jgi:hypothetical protein
MKTTINNCERCGQVHTDLPMQPFTRPVCYRSLPIATHFALCPTNGEPILIHAKHYQLGEAQQ